MEFSFVDDECSEYYRQKMKTNGRIAGFEVLIAVII
jgi:hypothetical protein